VIVTRLIRPSEHFQTTVTLIVGKEKKAYTLHKDLLCFYSDYFRAALNGNFKEAAERKLELPDVAIPLFEAFQVWLYTRDLQGPTDTTEIYHFLASMWLLGDQHQIPLLQNQAMNGIFAKLVETNLFSFSMIPLVYEKTVAGCPLRKAVMEIVAWTMDFKDWSPSTMGWTVECLSDLVLAIHETRLRKEFVWPGLPQRDKCFFHIHGKDEHC